MDIKRLLMAAVGLVAVGGFVWLAYAFYQKTGIGDKPQLTLENGSYLGRHARALPEWELHDTQGADFSRQNFAGRWSFVFLGYTSCPDICPPTIMQMQRLIRFIERQDDDIEAPQMVFISVDPQHDTAERMQTFLNQFGQDVIGVLGKKQTVEVVNQFFATHTQERENEDGVRLIDHSSKLFVINPDGRLIAMLNPPFTSTELFDAYRRIRSDHTTVARKGAPIKVSKLAIGILNQGTPLLLPH